MSFKRIPFLLSPPHVKGLCVSKVLFSLKKKKKELLRPLPCKLENREKKEKKNKTQSIGDEKT